MEILVQMVTRARNIRLSCCVPLALAMLATDCTPNTAYSPPPQKTVPQGADPDPVHSVVHMGDSDADAFILRDITRGLTGAGFRWTGQRPRVKLWLDERKDRELYLLFGIIPDTFKQTGPVTIGIIVNGTMLADPRFDAARDYEYSLAVQKELLESASPTVVELDIAPVFIAPPYGERLGICLQAIGFRGKHHK